jgi:hypothetical protein
MILALGTTGCESSDPYEAAAEKTVAKVKEFTTIVQGVKTESDAAAAAPKLEALATDFEAISADLKQQPKMTAEQRQKVKKIFDDAKGDMDKISEADSMPDITDPVVGQKVVQATMKASVAMMDVAMRFELGDFAGQ